MPKEKKRPRLRTTLFIIILLFSTVPMVFTGKLLLDSAARREIELYSAEMQGQLLILANQLVAEDYLNEPGSDMEKVIRDMADIWSSRIQIIDPDLRIRYDSYRVDVLKYNISEYLVESLSGRAVSSYDEEDQVLALTQPLLRQPEAQPAEASGETEEAAAEPELLGVVLVTNDMSARLASVNEMSSTAFFVWAAAFALIILLAVLVLIYVERPFRQLVTQIDGATDGSLNERVHVRRYQETAKISDSFNRMMNRLQRLDESRQEFVSNVSHELKTPLTSVRLLADTILSMDDPSPELYKEFMTDISKEIDRESKTIDDLLSLSRLDKTSESLNISNVNINELTELTLQRLAPIAVAAKVEVVLESYRPILAEADPEKLALAVMNLVENAIKYNKEGGWVKVSLNADHKYYYIKIADSGTGIPEQETDHIFERFYRVDKDRSRETGGTGLGLSITKSVVSLHHGAIRVYSKVGEGTTFVMRLPLLQSARRQEDRK